LSVLGQLLLEHIWKGGADYRQRGKRVVTGNPSPRRVEQNKARSDVPPLVLSGLRVQIPVERLDLTAEGAPVVRIVERDNQLRQQRVLHRSSLTHGVVTSNRCAERVLWRRWIQQRRDE
jgi:hypothetical protein